MTPHVLDESLGDWLHVRHIIYYAKRPQQLSRDNGVKLRTAFGSTAWGLVETITVVTRGVLEDDIWTEIRIGWNTPWVHANPLTEMTRDNSIATVREVEKIIGELPRC
jgi:hypothetical protein